MTKIKGEKFISVNISNKEISFTEYNMCDFVNVDLSGSNLEYVSFVGCVIKNMTIDKCKMKNVAFIDCNIDTPNGAWKEYQKQLDGNRNTGVILQNCLVDLEPVNCIRKDCMDQYLEYMSNNTKKNESTNA